MPLDPSIAAKIEGYQREIEREKSDNRRRFPVAAELKQAVERVFGKCRVIRAGTFATGAEIGERVDAHAWLPWPDFGAYGDAGVSVSRNSTVKRK